MATTSRKLSSHAKRARVIAPTVKQSERARVARTATSKIKTTASVTGRAASSAKR